jgi:hypothetical protein
MAERKLTKFAFWEYDQPPYVLGTETDGKCDKDGTVSVPSYGVRARLKPLKLMDAEEGRALLKRIQGLDAHRRAACNDAYRLFKQDVLKVAPFMKRILKTD